MKSDTSCSHVALGTKGFIDCGVVFIIYNVCAPQGRFLNDFAQVETDDGMRKGYTHL